MKNTENQSIPIQEVKLINLGISNNVRDKIVNIIGKEKYNELAKFVISWDSFFIKLPKTLSKKEIIRKLIDNDDFKAIVNIHQQIKSLQQENKEGLSSFLLDLVHSGQFEFLINYMNITKEVPKGYQKVFINDLGFATEVLEIINLLGQDKEVDYV
ncbi:hypothetical protein Trichorick_01450 (plasmid) [Candidatus Trichorickettsia mobilis]|uniref:Uncharacterized protein n=1 Tax=Candidatus Trichorickettsia mobilis TaxID=1346319 RepID=A0ABZ0UY44_9RICK|nr:hypothetical protein [Candidatus Trichorickettsia mobilis]WPY01537.1 hypothetical protein Trichorick_01450 [Candidatus Trichorickettsia mobilis]